MSEFVSGSPRQTEGRELAGPLRRMQWVVGLGLPPTPTHSLQPVLLASFPHLSPPPCLHAFVDPPGHGGSLSQESDGQEWSMAFSISTLGQGPVRSL